MSSLKIPDPAAPVIVSDSLKKILFTVIEGADSPIGAIADKVKSALAPKPRKSARDVWAMVPVTLVPNPKSSVQVPDEVVGEIGPFDVNVSWP